jgi:hypothetical protein
VVVEWEKMESHRKGFLKLKCFPPIKILTSPLFKETLEAFLSLSLFVFYSISWGLWGFDDIWGENHFFKNFFSNGFNILAMDVYSEMELCTPTLLNHDYEDGGVVDISVVDTYSGVELCTSIFLVRLANNLFGWQIIFKKFQNSKWTHPLRKLNTIKSCYVENIWLW